jgi:methylmalonyl-CoA mutase cobalamin-binding subunit
MGSRVPVVPATILSEIAEMSHAALAEADATLRPAVKGLRVLVATSDVHEHGKMLIDEMLRQLGAEALDGGTSTDPGPLAALAARLQPDAIAISTYNGVALAYFQALQKELRARDLSNSSLPMDVGDRLAAEGALVCRAASDLLPALARFRQSRAADARDP